MSNVLKIIILVCILSEISFSYPAKVFLQVPFTPQAPFGNWGEPYQEACEEASVLMSMRYIHHKGITNIEAKREIDNMVKFQEENYKGHKDLTVRQTGKLLKDYYGFDKFRVIESATIESILSALGNGNLVIVPLDGRTVGNPYYTRPGPAYHMVIVKGYDLGKKEFITNDPGTKRGSNYRYKFDVLYNAIHDWPGSKDKMSKGKKNILAIMIK
ncbi:hypothetical protein A2230_03980 [candidate division WOR-1 bacterium RIFOXYA2_FULL_36_21]|uniref:Peptidase C39-like domain-containing protein n=1 Tax=candidate division WOR-1 bacterium RIFOXYB2_FULL_36_35 TaxID=1802578 RepID=A0A1F4S104_UNCSA|nr:MAG: hypothetical protein A2230_03980 [candidate division WOR-1 bacterium RIFOXYA2_FULL_36_21]OGC14125.1 MAG: hypothetical protein A2290_06450 [candidate division WOR-1 bacterium RIFOXYB2_FULL_36_35]OGC16499.1 MAG: hypothetical protein A2282_02060 [candidate division WOR-1 bacterium RIFOXYA12_FULL_36_13]